MKSLKALINKKDTGWLCFWCFTISVTGLWNAVFLNRPAFMRLINGFLNTAFIALTVVVLTMILAWSVTLILHFLTVKKMRLFYMVMMFLMNMIRSVPQIVGILLGYISITILVERGIIRNSLSIFIIMALVMSIFIFIEMVDLMRERISHFMKSDFYSAMRVCGIGEYRIVNHDILWKNSRVHIFNKLIAVLGSAVFLQCSVDFIISVGLSSNVNAINFPVTLGSLLARIDSKQDILAIGHTLTSPDYFGNLFFNHLQGVTIAFVIVFTLVSIFNISRGFAERHRL